MRCARARIANATDAHERDARRRARLTLVRGDAAWLDAAFA
ncbi:hypothetical protein BURMUCF1_A1762 [Burkholderia multivorans ATCC BAA-247]|uniref:Uncharacterized protein n=1 Tax=Burkholderia multivorans CGD2 TaxID=513052 RepID=B9BL40_9BURK|nr:hypothetical protein BURMUCGD2_5798 [Burkholderia multivorans CGD2]EEE16342.1 hypothetical protein BURMUCGD2M_5787 [Burkholderia multivorans CGD2M]EJO53367.1 hypothetical protein BURMUCF1_A1762 [Burkholderia multivorans ATCC BAA-247]